MVIARTKPARVCGASLPSIFSPCTMPAQLTSPCKPPKPSTAAPTAALPLASSVTSVFQKRAARPSSVASAAPTSALTSASTTLPPPATIILAVAAPRPEAPPVTMNVLFFRSIGSFPSHFPSFRRRLDDRHRGRDQPGHVRKVGRHDQRVVGLGEESEGADVVFRDPHVDRLQAAFRLYRRGDLANGRRIGFGGEERRLRFAPRVVSLRL